MDELVSLIMFVLVCDAEEIWLCVRSDVGCCVRGRGVNGVAEKVMGSKQEPRLELRNLVGAVNDAPEKRSLDLEVKPQGGSGDREWAIHGLPLPWGSLPCTRATRITVGRPTRIPIWSLSIYMCIGFEREDVNRSSRGPNSDVFGFVSVFYFVVCFGSGSSILRKH